MYRRPVLIFLVAFCAAIAGGCSEGSGCPTCPIVDPPPPPPDPPPAPPELAYTRIMAFGDSLTEGESAGTLAMFPLHDPGTPGVFTSYPSRLLALLHARYTGQAFNVFNAGIGGSSASTDVPRFAEYLGIYKPEVVILLHGVNDLNGKVAFQIIIEAIESMIAEAKERDVQLLLSTLPRQRPDGKRAFADELIEPFNDELQKSALDTGVPLIDIHPHITLDMLTPDGLHITPTGNQKLAEIYFEALKARYELPAAAGARLP